MANRHWPHVSAGDVARYGFRYGAAIVQRLAHVEGRYHVLSIDTPYRHVQVGVSPTGRAVRVWVDGEEVTRRVR